MSKKKKNIEMRIYELLGIKTFRKAAFSLRDRIYKMIDKNLSSEELYNTASNYNIGKIRSLEDIKNFKKELYINTIIHILSLILLLPSFLSIFNGVGSLIKTILLLPLVIINIYSIMLQRYNCIRINQVIKKLTPHYEKQKDKLKDEVRKNDSLLLTHTYKIIDKKKNEKNITFEDLIANATIEELKQYNEYLKTLQLRRQAIEKNTLYANDNHLPLTKSKRKKKLLKIEFRPNNEPVKQ
jgi:hypothetical protein